VTNRADGLNTSLAGRYAIEREQPDNRQAHLGDGRKPRRTRRIVVNRRYRNKSVPLIANELGMKAIVPFQTRLNSGTMRCKASGVNCEW